MKMVRRQNRPLNRQIHEGLLIDTFNGFKLLNRKGEWGSNLQPKLEVEGLGHQGKRRHDRDDEGDSPTEQKEGQGGAPVQQGSNPKMRIRKCNRSEWPEPPEEDERQDAPGVQRKTHLYWSRNSPRVLRS